MLQSVRKTVDMRADYEVDGARVVEFSSRINEQGISNGVSQSIRDQELFNEHRNDIRRASRDFEDKVWEEEDRIAASNGEEEQA